MGRQLAMAFCVCLGWFVRLSEPLGGGAGKLNARLLSEASGPVVTVLGLCQAGMLSHALSTLRGLEVSSKPA